MQSHKTTWQSLAIHAVLVGLPVAAFTYWVVQTHGVHIHLSRQGLAFYAGATTVAALEWALWRRGQPRKIELRLSEDSGCYRVSLQSVPGLAFGPHSEDDLCLATRFERDRPRRGGRDSAWSRVRRVHCLVDDRLWVWLECWHDGE